MNGINAGFDNPWVLWAFFVFVPLFVLDLLRRRTGQTGLYFNSTGTEKNHLREFRVRCALSALCYHLFLGCIILALAGPHWGSRVVRSYYRGLDLVLALDLSRSMEVRDISAGPSGGEPGSRLDRALELATSLVNRNRGLRTGAAIGRGRGILAIPLTHDTEGILDFLEGLRGSAITGTGTNLESLIDAAAGAFQDAFPGRRGIVLFSDGEALSGSLGAALDRAKEAGIVVSVIGLGTLAGGPVPLASSPGGLLLDGEGQPVISSRQDEALREAAHRTGGLYLDGNRGDTVPLMAEYLRSLSSGVGPGASRREPGARWQIFVVAALVFWGLSRCLGLKRRQFRSILLALALSGLSSCSVVPGQLLVMEGNFFSSRGMYTEAIASYLKALDYVEAAPYAEYGLGSVYSVLEEETAALERFEAAEQALGELNRKHPELVYRIRYNRGNLYFEQGDYTGAAEAFREALEIDGGRVEAKRNLELSLLALSHEAASPTSGQSGERESMEVLFEYIRMKERDWWKHKEWFGEDTFAELDY